MTVWPVVSQQTHIFLAWMCLLYICTLHPNYRHLRVQPAHYVGTLYCIHLFNSVHICARWFCEALAGEMSRFLTFLALEPGCRTVESWSVSCVSTAFTHVWIKGHLRFQFVLFLSLSVWLPLLGVWLKWIFLLDGFANADLSPYASLSSFALCLLGCLVFGLG